jgi:hypothetical protein
MLRLTALAALAVVFAAPAQDVLAAYGWTRSLVAERAWNTLAVGPDEEFDLAYQISPGKHLKSVAPSARVAVTRAILGAIKSSLESAEGLKLWRQSLEPDPPNSPEAVLADEESRLATPLEEQGIAPEDMPDLKGFRQHLSDDIARRKRTLPSDMASYRSELARWKARRDDPAAAQKLELRSFLARFLAQTDQFPWGAKLVADPKGVQRFAEPQLEKKPLWWKACFRAGREPTDAARQFAAAWLQELGGPP